MALAGLVIMFKPFRFHGVVNYLVLLAIQSTPFERNCQKRVTHAHYMRNLSFYIPVNAISDSISLEYLEHHTAIHYIFYQLRAFIICFEGCVFLFLIVPPI